MRREPQRRVGTVPRPAIWAVGLFLAAQIGWHALLPAPQARGEDLPPAPSIAALRLASLGDSATLARLLTLYVQAFDAQPGILLPLNRLDYARLEAWLGRILELDPGTEAPLFLASRIYAEVPDPARQRSMLDFIHREFLHAPNRRWPHLAHAALVAKHRLGDLELALRYARSIRTRTTPDGVPPWARQMEAFILEDLGELEAAKVLLGAMLESGEISDAAEANYLKGYLDRLESRAAASH